MKISKRTVDAANEKQDRYTLWDDDITGFGLVVRPSGIKSYVFDYRTANSRKRRVTIGKHGPWTPHKARLKAEDYRDTVRAGGDPLGDKQAARQAITVGNLLDAYLASAIFADKAASTQVTDRGRIERHLRPLLGREGADDIEANQPLNDRVEDTKTTAETRWLKGEKPQR